MKQNITPENISEIKHNEIFVFGSNLKGIHGAGAAKLAYKKFGAILGKGAGLMGQSYGIPTKEDPWKTLPLVTIAKFVEVFLYFALEDKLHIFLITQIGCGYAGYSPNDIAPMFKQAQNKSNIYLPQKFIQ